MKKLWLHEPTDFPGHSQVTILDCSPQRKAGHQFWVAHFVPAHQVIELEHYRNEHTEPYRTRIPMVAVKRFD